MKIHSLLFLLLFCGLLQAQENTTDKVVPFEMKFEYHYSQVFLTATEGCNWLQLQFNFFPHEDAKLIDNMGVATFTEDLYAKIKDDRTFLFTLKRTETGFEIVGLKGAIWENVSFDCPENYCKWRITHDDVSMYTE